VGSCLELTVAAPRTLKTVVLLLIDANIEVSKVHLILVIASV